MKDFLYGIIFYSAFQKVFEILINIGLQISLVLNLNDFAILCILCLIMFCLLLFLVYLKNPKRVTLPYYILFFATVVLLNANTEKISLFMMNKTVVYWGVKCCRTVFAISFIIISYIKILKLVKVAKQHLLSIEQLRILNSADTFDWYSISVPLPKTAYTWTGSKVGGE